MQREFTFEDFVAQMTQVSRLGPAPVALTRRLGLPELDLGAEVRRLRAVCCSMTTWERKHPGRLDASRRGRIAAGAGVGTVQGSQLIRQFEMTRQVVRRAHSMSWRGRVGVVLGLVTGDPSHRDPSYVTPLPDADGQGLIRVAVAFAMCALAALACVILRPG